MLDLFRKRGLSSIVYGVIIVGMSLVFVIQFRPNANTKTSSLNEACVARVRGWCIDPKDHRASYRLLIPRDRQGNLLTGRAKSMGLSRIALDGLIERELLVSEADRLGLKATDDEITDQIYQGFIRVSVPSDNPQLAASLSVGPEGKIYAGFKDQKTHEFDVKVYERMLRSLVGRSPTEFREEQGREILAGKVRELVRSSVRVSDQEAMDRYVAEKSSAVVSYVPVRQSYVARYAVKPAQADIDAWLADKGNADAVDSLAKTREADDAPKANHIRHILIKVDPQGTPEARGEALVKLSAARARILAGEGFADVARDVSDDKGSAVRGGDVGDKTDGFVAPFKKAADALKPGETTATAIETQFGFHLIMKDDPAKDAEVKALVKKDVARELYVKSKALEKTKELAGKLVADLTAGKKAEDAIASLIASLPKPATAVAVMDVTHDDSNADAGAPKMDVPKSLAPDTDPDRPQLVTSSAFNKTGDPIAALSSTGNQDVVAFAFGAKDGDVRKEPIRGEDGFVVVTAKEHKLATAEDFDKERDVYEATMLAAKQAEALSLYVKRLKEAAKAEIKIDEQYLIDSRSDAGASPTDEDEDQGP